MYNVTVAAFRVSVSNTVSCFFVLEVVMRKGVFYTEIAYALGLLLLAAGTALTAWADFGISMVVAPAYIVYLKLSEVLPWFTFGMAEYVLQAIILGLLMILMKKAKPGYFLSFGTTVLYGLLLDGAMGLTALIPFTSVTTRVFVYVFGVLLCTSGIAMLFDTYLPPAAYELFVKEISQKKGWDIHKCKTAYDCVSCLAAAGISLLLFGCFEGIGIGTVLCAFVYGWLIGLFSKVYRKLWIFKDRFPWRGIFE